MNVSVGVGMFPTGITKYGGHFSSSVFFYGVDQAGLTVFASTVTD